MERRLSQLISSVSNSAPSPIATTNTSTTTSSKFSDAVSSLTGSGSNSSSSSDEETTSSIKKLADGTSILVVMQGTKVISQTKIGVAPQQDDNSSTQSQMNQYLSDGDLPAGSLFTAAC